MKGNKAKAAVCQGQMTNYEMQRLERLQFNAERMRGRGSGTMADKILEQQAKVLDVSSGKGVENQEEQDEESTSEYNGVGDEDENTSSMEAKNTTRGKRKANSEVYKQTCFCLFHPKTASAFCCRLGVSIAYVHGSKQLIMITSFGI